MIQTFKAYFLPFVIMTILLSWAKLTIGFSEDHYITEGWSAEKEERFDDAIIEYKKAIELNPKLIPAYYSLGRIYQDKRKDYKAAIQIYKKGLKYAPNDFGLNLNLMQAYFSIGNIVQGMNYYRFLSNIRSAGNRYSLPRDILNEITKGMSQEKIITFCRKNLQLNPTDNMLRELLSSQYMKKFNYENAKKEYKIMLKNGYESGFIYFNLGICDYHLGFYRDAKKNLTIAKQLGEKVPTQYFDMIDIKIVESDSF